MPDYYRILNLNENAALSDKEVKDAYFKLAKEWHPDSNKSVDAPSRFRLINEAYSNLKSKEQRIQYRFDVQQEAIIEHDNDWTKRHSRNRRHINPYAANFNDVNYAYCIKYLQHCNIRIRAWSWSSCCVLRGGN